MEQISFPGLVGVPSEEAKAQILAQHPNLNVIKLGVNDMCIKDYRLDRVWLVVDENDKVAKEPRTG